MGVSQWYCQVSDDRSADTPACSGAFSGHNVISSRASSPGKSPAQNTKNKTQPAQAARRAKVAEQPRLWSRQIDSVVEDGKKQRNNEVRRGPEDNALSTICFLVENCPIKAHALHHLAVVQSLEAGQKAQHRQKNRNIPCQHLKQAPLRQVLCPILNELRERYRNDALHAANPLSPVMTATRHVACNPNKHIGILPTRPAG